MIRSVHTLTPVTLKSPAPRLSVWSSVSVSSFNAGPECNKSLTRSVSALKVTGSSEARTHWLCKTSYSKQDAQCFKTSQYACLNSPDCRDSTAQSPGDRDRNTRLRPPSRSRSQARTQRWVAEVVSSSGGWNAAAMTSQRNLRFPRAVLKDGVQQRSRILLITRATQYRVQELPQQFASDHCFSLYPSMTRPVQRAAQQNKRWFARNEALLVKVGFARSVLGM